MPTSNNAARTLLPVFALLVIAGTRAATNRPLKAESAPKPAPRVTYIATAAPKPATLAPPVEPARAARVDAIDAVAAPAPTAALAPTLEPTSAPAPAPAVVPALPASALIDGIVHQQQTWNNCGPANLSMLLQHFGRAETQRDAAKFLKPVREDKNVSPNEMVAYAQSLGFRARWVTGGDLNLIRGFVAAGIPVIVESWFIPHENDEMGHYELIHGFDGDQFISDDSYLGANQRLNATELDGLWKVFNRTLIVVWREDQEPQVRALLGERWDEPRMHKLALETARREVAADPGDKFAWFNIGTNLLALGDPAGATTAFEKADALKLPWRMLWYQHGPFEANFLAGNYERVIKIANKALKSTGDLEESYYWRGKALLASGKAADARRDFGIAIKLNVNYIAAVEALKNVK